MSADDDVRVAITPHGRAALRQHEHAAVELLREAHAELENIAAAAEALAPKCTNPVPVRHLATMARKILAKHGKVPA